MKTILFLILMCGIARADVFVVTAPDASVVSLSEQDDAVVPAGFKKDVIKNKQIKDLTVSMGEERLYDFNGGKFILNAQKVKDKNKAESDAILKNQKSSTDRQSGLAKLKVLGLTDNELAALFR